MLQEIFGRVVKRIAIDMVNHLAGLDQVIRVCIIPRIMRPVNIASLVDGGMSGSFVRRDPYHEIILSPAMTSPGGPAALEILPDGSRKANGYFGSYLGRHTARGLIGAGPRTVSWKFVGSMNPRKGYSAYRALGGSFHARDYSMDLALIQAHERG